MDLNRSGGSFKRGPWDYWGIVLSSLCMVHCIALPLILYFAPAVTAYFIPSEDITHTVLLGFILGAAGFAFISGYRVHRQKKPVVWMSVGIFVIIFATFFAHSYIGHWSEPTFAVIGSLALVRAHLLNAKHCRACHDRGECHGDD